MKVAPPYRRLWELVACFYEMGDAGVAPARQILSRPSSVLATYSTLCMGRAGGLR